MKMRPIVSALAVALVVTAAGEARAQLFSNSRTLGSPLAGRSRTAATTDPSKVGSLTGSERFVRGNRDATDFVGTDARDTGYFVGAGVTASAAAASRLSAQAVRIERAPDANRSAVLSNSRTSRNGVYNPRLAVGFEHPPRAPVDVNTTLSGQLATSLARRLELTAAKDQTRSIEVSLEGGKATLRGTVPSEREKTLAGLLALFEPGISEVQNQLVVKAGPAPGTQPAPQAAVVEQPPPAAPQGSGPR